jgi:polar amino acid transport system substrate-binding protein
MKRRSSLAIVAVGAMLALSACGGGDSEPAATAEGGVPLVKEGQLTTCTHLSY